MPDPTLANYLQSVEKMLASGNLSLADLAAQMALAHDAGSAPAWSAFGRVATAAKQPALARHAFERALAIDPYFKPAAKNLKAITTFETSSSQPRYLVIREWGAGFWSDVGHVISGLLLAQLSGREPIVWWGESSRFRDTQTSNAWELYFEPVSSAAIDQTAGLDTWPPKWQGNPRGPVVNRYQGPDSRLSAPAFLPRAEPVCVSDFFSDIFLLRNWLLPTHPLAGKSASDIISSLAQQYIRPLPRFREEAAAFAQRHMGPDTIALHLRGLDKPGEFGQQIVGQAQAEAMQRASAALTASPDAKLLVLTDDTRILAHLQAAHGPRVITTDVLRAAGTTGLHFTPGYSGHVLGQQVLLDVCIALHANQFIGLASSNVSYCIRALKQWGPRATLCGYGLHQDFGIALGTLTAGH